MLSKKLVVNEATTRPFQSRLEYLMARRTALDLLIQELEEYDRCRTRRLELLKRKSA